MHDPKRDDDEAGGAPPSRGKERRAQHAVDDQLWRLAQKLTSMSPAARDKLPLSDELRDEIALAASIAPSTGKRRQLRRVTSLLRESGTEAIERALHPPRVSPNAAPASPADQWLERLVTEGDPALQALVEAYPDADRTRIRQWLRTVVQARKRAAEAREAGAPTPPKDKAEKALRKYLATVVSEG